MSILFIFHYIFVRLAKQSQFIPLQNVVYFITLSVLVHKIFTFYINGVILFNVQFQGQRVNEVQQTDTVETAVVQHSVFKVEMAIEKLKSYKSRANCQIWVHLTQAEVKQYVPRSIHIYVNHCTDTCRAIKVSVVIIKIYHCYQPHTILLNILLSH